MYDVSMVEEVKRNRFGIGKKVKLVFENNGVKRHYFWFLNSLLLIDCYARYMGIVGSGSYLG